MPSSIRGYSLYELLVTLAVAATLVILGVPSAGKLVAKSRQHAEINALFHAVHLARKESITKRRTVSLCPSSDGETCTSGRDWSAGWMMFVNSDRDWPPARDAGERVLRRHEPGPGARILANRAGFTLRGTGLRATNGTFVVCDTAGRVPAKALVVSYTGRPRTALTTQRGRPYACAH